MNFSVQMDEHNMRLRNRQIEGLRGGSIIIIVLYHIFCRYQQIFMNSSIWWMESWGNFGVGIFFTISCYFLVDPNKTEKRFDVIRFLTKRLMRLWPCYFISITIISIMVHIWELPNRGSSVLDYFLNIFFVNGYIGTPYVDGAHWYLTTLISITIIIAIASKFRVMKNPWFYIIWVVTIEVLQMSNFKILAKVVGGGYVGYMAIAVALRFLLQFKQVSNVSSDFILWVGTLFSGIVLIYLSVGHVAAYELVIILPIFIACLFQKCSILEFKGFQFFGIISYPLYLIHQNLSFEIEYHWMMYNSGAYRYYYGIVALMVVIIVSVLLYWLTQKLNEKMLAKCKTK